MQDILSKKSTQSGWMAGLLFITFGLAGCAGGGGDEGAGFTPLAYTGSTLPAVITAGNANQLAGAVLGASTFTGGVAAGAVESPGGASGFASSIPLVAAAMQRAIAHAPMGQLPVTGLVIPIILPPIPGTFGGTLTISGSIDDATLTGNLTMTFVNFSEINGEVMNGTVDADINSFDFGSFIPLDMLMSFSNFAYAGVAGSFTMQGTIHALTDLGANSEMLTANLIALDNGTGETSRVDNLVVDSIFDNVLAPTTADVTMAGRVFEPTHGYVDVSTTAPLIFSNIANLFPNSGGPVVLTGDIATFGVSSIQITPQSFVNVLIEVDANGDGLYEDSNIVPWTSL